MTSLLSQLPPIRGQYRENADLAGTTWFRVGGAAEVLFKPADTEDLAFFLKNKPKDIPVTVIGVGSNLLVRDGGVPGVVIRLGRGFVEIAVTPSNDGVWPPDAVMRRHDSLITAGAGALSLNVARYAQMQGIGGLEFLSGIPGTIGGALRMNGGAYGSDTAAVFVEAEAVDASGNIHRLDRAMGFTYRHCAIPEDWIFTRAVLQGHSTPPEEIAHRMQEIAAKREASQPIRTCTGGSTFKNPPGEKKAWQLIDEAGCRGLKLGGAQVSELHCNFLINTGDATAADIENLGEEVRRRVQENSGILLEWEIRRIGILP